MHVSINCKSKDYLPDTAVTYSFVLLFRIVALHSFLSFLDLSNFLPFCHVYSLYSFFCYSLTLFQSLFLSVFSVNVKLFHFFFSSLCVQNVFAFPVVSNGFFVVSIALKFSLYSLVLSMIFSVFVVRRAFVISRLFFI